MKKVLFVVTDRKIGGVSIVLEDILNNLSLKKYKIDLLILNDEGDKIVGNIDEKINIIYGSSLFKAIDTPISYFKKHFDIKLFFNKIRLIFLLKTGLIKKRLKKERQKILSEKYDVEVAFKDGFCAIFTAVGDTPRKIHWLHSTYAENDPTRRYRKTFESIYNDFNSIIAVSKNTAKGFNKQYNYQNKVTVIPNIIDDKKIKKFAKKTEKLSDKKNNFVSVGRLSKQKGYDRLLKVVAKLKEEGLFNDSYLTIIGDGEEKENLMNLKNELKLEEVNFVGVQENPYKFVAGADAYISAARYEPFGLVMVEALILHKPILATKTEATDTIINDNCNGLIVDNSSEALYKGLKKLVTNKKFLASLKKEAKKYDYSKTNKEIIKSIENILDN